MIINAGGKFYTTTVHADEKMLIWNIDEADVMKVIDEGAVDFTRDGDEIYRLTVQGRDIAVIIVDEERIKTVYVVE
jgi:hypothetical protein